MKKYSKQQLIKDITAGFIVAIIALPLSIALALASGATPEQGLYTAIAAGFVISFLGGSRVQIAGPTAAFASIVAGVIATNGFSGLVIATILAGIMLILMGVFKLGTLIKYIPHTITVGFTSGIAVTILLGQIKDFLGITYGEGIKPIEAFEKMDDEARESFYKTVFLNDDSEYAAKLRDEDKTAAEIISAIEQSCSSPSLEKRTISSILLRSSGRNTS